MRMRIQVPHADGPINAMLDAAGCSTTNSDLVCARGLEKLAHPLPRHAMTPGTEEHNGGPACEHIKLPRPTPTQWEVGAAHVP